MFLTLSGLIWSTDNSLHGTVFWEVTGQRVRGVGKRGFGMILGKLCQVVSIFIIFHPYKYAIHLSSE